jgi:hypothetical protein
VRQFWRQSRASTTTTTAIRITATQPPVTKV